MVSGEPDCTKRPKNPVGLPDFTKAIVVYEPEVPVTLTKSEMLGKKISTTKAEEAQADFSIGEKGLKSLAILTDVPALPDYVYCLILDAEGNVVGEPISSVNKLPLFGVICLTFAVAWKVPTGGIVRVICYGDRAKNFQVSIEAVS